MGGGEILAWRSGDGRAQQLEHLLMAIEQQAARAGEPPIGGRGIESVGMADLNNPIIIGESS